MDDWREAVRAALAKLDLAPEREVEIVEELAQHLEQRHEELVLRGTPPAEAARILHGELESGLAAGLAKVAPRARPATPAGGDASSARPSLFGGLLRDVRYGARQLRANPGFATVAILSLALGTGANTALFQLLDALRLRALPVAHPEELAVVKIVNSKSRTGSFRGRNPQLTSALWDEIRERQQGFSRIAAFSNERMDLSRGGESRFAETLWVSGDFFGMLGVSPVAGRLISPGDDVKGCGTESAVLSEPFWRRELGGSPAAIGKTISLEGHSVTIAGVVRGGFTGVDVGRSFDVALPLCAEPLFHPERPNTADRRVWWLAVLGRLKPGWTPARASAQLAVISRPSMEATLPPYDATEVKRYLGFSLGAEAAGSGVSSLRRTYDGPLVLLMAIAALVLLIACANLANLMLARAGARQREMAVRLALGASRGRLVRQLLAESFLLAAAGTLLGAGLAQALSRVLVGFLARDQTRVVLDLSPDGRVLGFTIALVVATCLLFGLTPAIQAARTSPGEALKASARGVMGGRGGFGLRRALVVSQVALSLVLLVGALLFVRTLWNLTSQDPGFDRDRIVVADVDLSRLHLPEDRRLPARRELLARVRALPGVRGAAETYIVPLSGSGWNDNVGLPGSDPSKRLLANFDSVSPGYFDTMGMRLLAGRDLGDHDDAAAPRVAVVTETFARRLFGGGVPIGKRFVMAGDPGKPERVFEIVGLVRDAKYGDLREEFSPLVYVPVAQADVGGAPEPFAELVVRADGPLADVIAGIKRAAAETSPATLLSFRTFDSVVRDALLTERLMAALSGFFGLLAGVLAMVGLYGVVSYMVTRRRSEIGVRIALGADRRDIVRLVMSEAGRLLGIGLGAGTVLALAGATTARALLYGLSPGDPVTIALAAAALSGVTALASLLPARRAAGFDPVRALREE